MSKTAKPLSKHDRDVIVDTWMDATIPSAVGAETIMRYEATVRALEELLDDLRTYIHEEFGMQPVMSDTETVRALWTLTHERHVSRQPEWKWNRDLDGYEPQYGDWVLWRQDDMRGKSHLVGTFRKSGNQLRLGYAWEASTVEIVAYWRPPQPPPVPEGEQ